MSPWLISPDSGSIEVGNGQAKSVPTPAMIKVAFDVYLGGRTFLEISAGAMFRSRTARWYYTSDVMGHIASAPIVSDSLPQWPVSKVDEFVGIGLRF